MFQYYLTEYRIPTAVVSSRVPRVYFSTYHIAILLYMYVRMYMCTQALVAVKDRLREVEGPDMKERMQDQIRQWMIEVRSVCIMD